MTTPPTRNTTPKKTCTLRIVGVDAPGFYATPCVGVRWFIAEAADTSPMAEPEPRYVLTFKPATPEMVVVSLAALVGAGVAVFFSWVVNEIACEGAASPEDCGHGGTALLTIALIGLVPALGMVVESARPGGHPWYWFLAGALVYGFWAVVFASVVS
jgi:hypothetical protein